MVPDFEFQLPPDFGFSFLFGRTSHGQMFLGMNKLTCLVLQTAATVYFRARPRERDTGLTRRVSFQRDMRGQHV